MNLSGLRYEGQICLHHAERISEEDSIPEKTSIWRKPPVKVVLRGKL